jgi:hypothetical protein
LASKASTVRAGPVQLRGTAMLWRMPAATVRWPCGVASLYCGPTSNSAGSDRPRASLRDAASIRLGRIEGRIVSSVASIELSSRTSAAPPPKRSAFFSGRKDQVTASFMPRAASARRACGVRRCSGSRTGRDMVDAGGSEVVGILSKPNTRVTSSTRSASPTMSGRHDGTEAVQGPLPSTPKPSLVRMEAVSAEETSMPVSVCTRSVRSV